uniref:Uncharacterized protein n=1 Tax=Anas zonorhyncha TaxID=75864 RepID=A0A8B9VR03_9AVES
ATAQPQPPAASAWGSFEENNNKTQRIGSFLLSRAKEGEAAELCGADKKGRKRRKKPSSAGVRLGVSARLPPPRWGCISGRQSDWEGPGVKATQERRPEPLSAIPKPVTLPSPSTCSVLRALRPPRRGCRARSPSPPPQPHGSMASTVSAYKEKMKELSLLSLICSCFHTQPHPNTIYQYGGT